MNIIRAILTTFLCWTTVATAQPKLEIVVPNPPGGTTDQVARHIQSILSSHTDRSVIVVNKPGAFGKIAMDYVTSNSTKKDMILIISTGTFVQSVIDSNNDLKNFYVVAPVMTTQSVLVTTTTSNIRNWKEFLARARNEPLSCGVSNGASNLAAQYLIKKLNLPNVEIIPFSGSTGVNTSLLGNHIQCAFDTLTTLQPLIQDGKLSILATMANKPPKQYPNLLSIEQNVPGFDFQNWYAVAVHDKSSTEFMNWYRLVMPQLLQGISSFDGVYATRPRADWISDQTQFVNTMLQYNKK